jgi:hypothetical protein
MITKFKIHKFDLEDGKFFSYNNRTISSDQPFSLIDINEKSLLRLVAWNIFEYNENSKLSFIYKLNRFFIHFKWADKHFTSGKGRINDSKFFVDEIVSLLTKLTHLTYLSSSELRELLISSIRIYVKDNWHACTPIQEEDLKRCVNLQEFYSNEVEINFEFAENLRNLRIVDLDVNDLNNEYGSYKGARYLYKTGTVIREVINIDKLKACKVLHLEDSYINDFSKIPDNIFTLSLRNSNFENIQTLAHLKKLEYLDISYTNLKFTDDLSKLQSIRILNLYFTKINETVDLVKFYHEILSLTNLEILIIDTDNLNLILPSNSTNIEFKNKILELTDSYKNGYIRSTEICEILKIAQRVKIEFNDSKYDFWNSPMGKDGEYKNSDIEIDFEKVKIELRDKLVYKSITKSKK